MMGAPFFEHDFERARVVDPAPTHPSRSRRAARPVAAQTGQAGQAGQMGQTVELTDHERFGLMEYVYETAAVQERLHTLLLRTLSHRALDVLGDDRGSGSGSGGGGSGGGGVGGSGGSSGGSSGGGGGGCGGNDGAHRADCSDGNGDTAAGQGQGRGRAGGRWLECMRALVPSLEEYLGLSRARMALLMQARAQFASFNGPEWVVRDRELRQREVATDRIAY